MVSAPLANKRILLTRPAEQIEAWRAPLEAAGATVVAYPTIRVEPPASWLLFDDAVANLERYEWVIFTSSAAVRFAAPRLPQPLRGLHVAAVGVQTSRALIEIGVHVDLVPDDQRQEGLAEELESRLRPGSRVLFPRAEGGREFLPDRLRLRGCVVDVVPASRTVAIPNLPLVPKVDAVVFASPSALRSFLAGPGLSALVDCTVVVIGPTTGETAKNAGLHFVTAQFPTADAVIDALVLGLAD